MDSTQGQMQAMAHHGGHPGRTLGGALWEGSHGWRGSTEQRQGGGAEMALLPLAVGRGGRVAMGSVGRGLDTGWGGGIASCRLLGGNSIFTISSNFKIGYCFYFAMKERGR